MADRYIGAQLRTMEPRGDTVSREVLREEIDPSRAAVAPLAGLSVPSDDRTSRRESVDERKCRIYSDVCTEGHP